MMTSIVEKVRDWKHQRFLKKRGWTQLAYERQMDPLIDKHADTTTQYYRGYKHVFEFTTTRHHPFTDYPTWTEAYTAMNEWCNETCTGRWREDIHRVFQQTGLDLDGAEHPEWHLNDIGGGDVLFYAFAEDSDAVLFKLRWL